MPFELTVDRAKLVTGKEYSVRGAFFSGARPTWVSEPVVVDVKSERIDLGILNMTVAKAQAFATTWRCGALEVTTSYSDQTMD